MASSTQQNPRFVGFKALSNRADSQPTSLECLSSETRSSTIVGSQTIGNCCPTSATCAFPTTCLLGTLFYDGSTRVCGTSSDCNSFTVLPSSAIITQLSTVDYFCYETLTTWPYPALYITDPALQAAAASSFTTSSTQPTASGSAAPSSVSSKGSSSKAWVAGAVIGPLALLCLIGAGVFFVLMRHRRRRKAMLPPSHDEYLASRPELDGGARPSSTVNSAHEMDGAWHDSEPKGLYAKEEPVTRQELGGTLSPAEMNALRPPVELTSEGANSTSVQPYSQTQTLQHQFHGTQPSRTAVYELDTKTSQRAAASTRDG